MRELETHSVFFTMLENLNIRLENTKAFQDHQHFEPQLLEKLAENQPLFMTEKDAVKCQALLKRIGGMFQLMRRLWRLKTKAKTSTIVGKNPSFGLTLFERNMREKLNPRLLDVIACPRCLARLKYDQENQRLICPFEQVAYPIENGVPVLLAEKAETLKNKEYLCHLQLLSLLVLHRAAYQGKPLADIAGKPMIPTCF